MFVYISSIYFSAHKHLTYFREQTKTETKATFCVRLMFTADEFLEITSRSSRALHPYQRPPSVVLSSETELKTKSAPRKTYSHTVLCI